MTCAAILMLTLVILFIGTLLLFGLLPTALALIVLGLVAIPLVILLLWRIIYPWLVRIGRWAAQVRNIVYLFFVLLVTALALPYILGLAGVSVSPTIIYIILGVIFLLLLLLGLVVWLVRLWRRGWPTTRNTFWDIWFRIGALFWRILLGIPLGITWFLYHPPLRWLVAALLFYLRWTSAAVAWLLYNPPLRSITTAGLFVMRLIARPTGWLLYNLPIRWLVATVLFTLRLIARSTSTIIYGIVSWWPVQGVRGMLKKGLTAESKSYEDYKYAQDDSSAAS
jgi:hypothetical protein